MALKNGLQPKISINTQTNIIKNKERNEPNPVKKSQLKHHNSPNSNQTPTHPAKNNPNHHPPTINPKSPPANSFNPPHPNQLPNPSDSSGHGLNMNVGQSIYAGG
jgi:hypothetical protein